MFINTKKSFKVKSDNGTVFEKKAGWIGEVPKWVEEHWFFKALCSDGSITAIVSKKDKDIAAALEPTEGSNPPPVAPNTGETPPTDNAPTDGDKTATDNTPPVNVGTATGKKSK